MKYIHHLQLKKTITLKICKITLMWDTNKMSKSTVDNGLYMTMMTYITNSAMDHSSKGPKIKTCVLRLIGLNYANHIPAHCISSVFPEHYIFILKVIYFNKIYVKQINYSQIISYNCKIFLWIWYIYCKTRNVGGYYIWRFWKYRNLLVAKI